MTREDNALPAFVTLPARKSFIYRNRQEEPLAKADVAKRYRDRFFMPARFATWMLVVEVQNGFRLDSKLVHSIAMALYGEFSNQRACSIDPAVGSHDGWALKALGGGASSVDDALSRSKQVAR